jgi:hypothetical protein
MKLLTFLILLFPLQGFASGKFELCIPRPEAAGVAREYEIKNDGTLSIPKGVGTVVSKNSTKDLDTIQVDAKDRAAGTHIFELHRVDRKPVRLVHTSPLFGNSNSQKSTLTRIFSYDANDRCFVKDIELVYNDGKDAKKTLVTFQKDGCEKFLKIYDSKKVTDCSQEYMGKCQENVSANCLENPTESCSSDSQKFCYSKLSGVCAEGAKKLVGNISNWDRELKKEKKELFGYKAEDLFVNEDPFALAMNIANNCRYTKDFYSPNREWWQVWKVFKKDHAVPDGDDDRAPRQENTGRDSR